MFRENFEKNTDGQNEIDLLQNDYYHFLIEDTKKQIKLLLDDLNEEILDKEDLGKIRNICADCFFVLEKLRKNSSLLDLKNIINKIESKIVLLGKSDNILDDMSQNCTDIMKKLQFSVEGYLINRIEENTKTWVADFPVKELPEFLQDKYYNQAIYSLNDLEKNTLKTNLVKIVNCIYDSEYKRKTDGRLPDWYRELCSQNVNLRRNIVVKILEKIRDKKDKQHKNIKFRNHSLVRECIHGMLIDGYDDIPVNVNNDVRWYFGQEPISDREEKLIEENDNCMDVDNEEWGEFEFPC